jgi:uncharacterized protein YxjI
VLFNRRQYFVKEHVALVKLTDTYDILDPESNQQIGIARVEPATWAKYARLLVKKALLPTTVNIYENEGSPPVLSLHKGPAFFRAKVRVTDAKGTYLGRFESKLFSLGGGFYVYDASDNRMAEVKGDWKGWNFKLLDAGGREIGLVTKKWAGIGKELFTSADNYMISLSDEAAGNPGTTALLLAASLAIDIVFKEGG